MKTLLTTILLVLCSLTWGQERLNIDPTAFYDGTEWHTSGIRPEDSLVCVERGHVLTGTCTSTLMWCPPYTVDYADSTVTVYPHCNTTTCLCARCGQAITTGGKETRVTTWRRNKYLEEQP